MVFLSRTLLSVKKIRGRTFLDKVRIYVRGGGGGQGHPKYGGQGGRGGHIYIVGQEDARLKQIITENPKKRFTATNGLNSKQRALFGEPGADIEIPVPLGICVRADGGRVLGEVNNPGDRVLVAKGGVGGGPTNRYLGQKGHAHSVTLDLKLIADVGLVGFPNAGKSTLLSVTSRAAPKIASYPFTTIQPQLGTMVYPDQRQITMADLPGLIEGAHLNVGMGHSFLKHVERTKLMLFVVDVQGFRLSAKHALRSALENILLLNRELELYKEELVHKPALLALNKVDVDGGERLAGEISEALRGQAYLSDVPPDFLPDRLIKFDEVIPISAKYRHNTEYLQGRLRELLDLYCDLSEGGPRGASGGLEVVGGQLVEHRGAKLV